MSWFSKRSKFPEKSIEPPEVVDASLETSQQKLQAEADRIFEMYRNSIDKFISKWTPKHADDTTIAMSFYKNRHPGLAQTTRDRLANHFIALGYTNVQWETDSVSGDEGLEHYWDFKLTIPTKTA